MFLDSTLSDSYVNKSLKNIEWGAIATADGDRAVWVDVIERYPNYVADLVAWQGTEDWRQSYDKAKKRKRENAAKRKSTVTT